MRHRRPAASAAGHVFLTTAACLSFDQALSAQQGSIWLEAHGSVTVPVGEEFGDFADPGLGVGGAVVYQATSRVTLAGVVEATGHDARDSFGDDWNVLVIQGQLGVDLVPGPGLVLSPLVGLGLVRFDPEPGTDLLDTVTPFAIGVGARVSVPVSGRLAVVGRAALIAALGDEAPGPGQSFIAPIGLGLALRL